MTPALRRAALLTLALGLALAVEIEPAAAATIPVSSLGDSSGGSLRNAIQIANITPARDQIVFDSDLSGTISLTSELPLLTEPVDIKGPGADQVTVHFPDTSSGVSYDNDLSSSRLDLEGLTLDNSNGVTVRSGTKVDLFEMAITDGGGALTVQGGDAGLFASTVSGNSFSAAPIRAIGGAIDVNASTVTQNDTSATASSGGVAASGGGDVKVLNSTLAGNSAPGGSGADLFTSGSGSTAVVANSIVANAAGGANPCGHNSGGTITSNDFNLEDADSCGFSQLHDKPNTEPILGSLDDWGGPTQTIFVSRLSPAVDAGQVAPDSVFSSENKDQRGLSRFQDQVDIPNASPGDTSDIGAFEHQAMKVSIIKNDGAGSLRQAIASANDEPGYDIVTFTQGLTGQIELLSPLEALTAMDIRGPGADKITLSATFSTNTSRIINQSTPFGLLSGVSKISGLTIANAHGAADGQGVLIGPDAKVEMDDVRITDNTTTGKAGGIVVRGDLTLTDSTVDDNESSAPGVGAAAGIYVDGGELTLDNSTVGDNSESSSGTGNLGVATNSTVTVTNSTIAGGSSSGGAGNVGGVTSLVSAGNTIVADPVAGTNCTGVLTSAGHNLDSGTSCGLGAAGDLTNADADLATLQVGGGSTPTFRLGLQSDAIDAGKALASATTDQRGLSRPVNFDGLAAEPTSDNSDIGSYERQNADSDGDGVGDGEDECPDGAGDGASGCPTVARTLTLALKGQKTFKGKLSGPSCTSAQKVTVYRSKGQKLAKVAKAKTKASGKYKAMAKKAPKKGTYVARVKARVIPDEAECLAAESDPLDV